MGAVAPERHSHVRLKPWAIPAIRSVHAVEGLDEEGLWLVELVDNGRGRDALWLRREADGAQLLVWRGQVSALPWCGYCGLEGHSASTGTTKNCPARKAEAVENRAKASERMKERWALIKAGKLPPPPRRKKGLEPFAAPVLAAEQEAPF